MGFLCCICHEDFKKGETDPENGKTTERPIVTTKCGHLFHSDCLKSWWQKQGTEVWTKKECPTCRMSLTVATDLIRIFTTSADDGSPSTEDFKLHISKLENANALLSNNLEMSFLRGRDQEKKITQISREMEKLQKAYMIEKSKSSQFQSDAAKLRNDNEELKNVIINLNKAMTSGNNGIHMGGGVHPMVLPMFPYNGPGQPVNMQGGQGGVNMNMFTNGHVPINHQPFVGSQQQQQQLSSWPPPPPNSGGDNQMSAANGMKNETLDPFGYMNISQNSQQYNNNSSKSIQNKVADDLTQLNSMFQGIMGLPSASASMTTSNSFGNRDIIKSSLEENNSSCIDSDSSRTNSETGDHSAKNKFDSGHNDGNNNTSLDNNGNSILNFSSTMNINGLTTMDQTPTDEMMDAILNSKSHPVPVKADEFFVQKKFPSTTTTRAPKGKTKWKAYEFEGGAGSEDKKMYGKFACKNCSAKWGTSRHSFNQSQTCLRCNEVVFPYDQGPVMTKEELSQQKLARSRK